jgi:hypothetical protein
MHSDLTRRMLSAALAAAFVLAVPAYGAKRRSVRQSLPGPKVTAVVTGIVLDASTGQPVPAVRVDASGRHDTTDAAGKFDFKSLEGLGDITLTASRSGYEAKTIRITQSGPANLTFQLTPTPTVAVKRTDNTTIHVDYESITFGYPVPFSGYYDNEYDDFCKADGTQLQVDRTQIKKITGPGTLVSVGNCCGDRQVEKVNLLLKNGQNFDASFSDSCQGYSIDLIGREHGTGQFVYIHFTDISEVVFP